MPTLTLRALIASAFTTKGSALDSTEFDNNFIQLKAEVDAVAASLASTTGHTQGTDLGLDTGGTNPVTAATIKAITDQLSAPVTADIGKVMRVKSDESIEYSEQVYGSYGENDNALQTAIGVAGTYEEIDCTLVEGDVTAKNLSVSGNVITVGAVEDCRLLIIWDITLIKTGGGADDHIDAAVFVNGAQQNVHIARDVNNSEKGRMGGSLIVDVESGWDIALKITNDDSTSDIVVSDQTISVTKIH